MKAASSVMHIKFITLWELLKCSCSNALTDVQQTVVIDKSGFFLTTILPNALRHIMHVKADQM